MKNTGQTIPSPLLRVSSIENPRGLKRLIDLSICGFCARTERNQPFKMRVVYFKLRVVRIIPDNDFSVHNPQGQFWRRWLGSEEGGSSFNRYERQIQQRCNERAQSEIRLHGQQECFQTVSELLRDPLVSSSSP